MIQLYKKGDSHTIKGVKCAMESFPVSLLKEKLKEGYVADPTELEVKPEEKPKRTRKAKKDA